MKHKPMRFMSLLLIAIFACSGTAAAQDPISAAPAMYKKLFENDQIRVLQVSFKPGEKIAQHSHPDHVVKVETAGKLKIFKPDGSANEMELTKDQILWIPAETHWAENTGKTDVVLTVTELKSARIKVSANK